MAGSIYIPFKKEGGAVYRRPVFLSSAQSQALAGNWAGKVFAKKLLTSGQWYVNIILVPNESTSKYARVVELVDSLASGASARKGVRVRLPPRAP